jgi:hypothetical protein
MRPQYAAVVGAIFVAASAAVAGAALRTHLRISGAFHTTSERAVDWSDEGCGYRPNGTLLYGSNALRIGRGPAVARVDFFIRHYRGPVKYDARGLAPYGRTTVQVVTARTAATGAASGFYIATSGNVTILQAKNVGRRGHKGFASGTVRARLRLMGGSRRLRLAGTWHCRIPPEANEG